jgi:putative protease
LNCALQANWNTSITPPRERDARRALQTENAPSALVLPELLSPAGDWECARAAVENGADAIYFGLERHNARLRANNFTAADLPRLMEFLHRRGVRGYACFNTLVFADEMAEAEQSLRVMIAAGVDAVLVQDVGICRLIRRLSPDVPIHASTQMTITSAAGVEFARELGCNLVVLARECSLTDIERIQTALAGQRAQVPLEVFIHGALCIAYSGQCLTSEALGGRSANRGECAQACRLPYDLICDGRVVPLGDRRYLLSPQDLAGLEVLPDLIRLGVASLKIEGRMKSPEYVANITRIYRNALDRIAAELSAAAATKARSWSPAAGDSREAPPSVPVALGGLARSLRAAARHDMEMAFSRGLYTGWLCGLNHQALVHARFGKKRGVYLGEISRIESHEVVVRLQAPLKPGDGVVFDAGRPDEKEEGGRVYSVHTRGVETLVGFGKGDVEFSRLHIGDRVWKTSDPELDHRLRRSFAGSQPQFQRPLKLQVYGAVGQPLSAVVRDELGHAVELTSAMPLLRAEKQPFTPERLRNQLGRLGGTPFRLGELESHLQGQVMLPVSELNRLRREAVAKLEALRAQPPRWRLSEGGRQSAECGVDSRPGATHVRHSAFPTPSLVVLVRRLAQLDAALGSGVRTVYCEFDNPKQYRDAVQLFRKWQHASLAASATSAIGNRQSAIGIYVAPPRVFKPGEEWVLKQVRSCDADGYLVRNYDHLRFFAGCRSIGDYSFNVANVLAADYFIHRCGLERVTASYDLNTAQLEALLRSAPPEWFEITLHQRMPMFHMEHCVFCALLSRSADDTSCGRPCDRHEVKLRDRVGAEHVVKADVGCRNTVFNAVAQTGAEAAARLMALGARRFRLEFLQETPDQVAQIVAKYGQLLRGQISGTQLGRELKLFNQLGVTRR